ncbi:hypothetical protein [Holdemania sp. 1001302B_160321_E10]|nr:hypothetical protein [Holdemania sp. 1001302B_160321_E10]
MEKRKDDSIGTGIRNVPLSMCKLALKINIRLKEMIKRLFAKLKEREQFS